MEGFALEDGRCKHLRFNNGCAIYETRPKICSVKKMAEESPLPVDIYYKITAKLCNKMQEAADMPVKFRVSI
jgi:Fe-S-cluster containining protein